MAAPTINIGDPPPSGVTGLTNVDNAEATTNWAGFRHSGGGSPSPGSETNVFVQGTQAISIKVSGSTRDEGIYFDIGTASGSVDMTGDAEKHVYIWAAMTDMAQLDSLQNGGFFIIIGSSTSNWNKYYVNGSDTIDGRFVRYVLDVTKTPSETAATAATLTAVTHIGIGCKAASITGKAENLVCDRIDYGTGLQVEDGDATTPGSWEEVFADDDSISNKYGIVEKKSGVYFVKGGIEIGDSNSTATTLWDDASGSTVVFENPQYYNGTAVVSAIDAAALYKIVLAGNGTGTTDITWGSVLGTGDDRQGVNGGRIESAGPKWALDGETDIADLDTVNLYGMSLQGAGVIALSGSTKTDVIGTTLTNCDEFQPNDAEVVNCNVIASVPDRGIEMLTTHNIVNTQHVGGSTADEAAERCWQVDISVTPDTFVEQTTGFNDATAANCTPFPATEGAGDYFAMGSFRKFAGVNIDTGTARSGGSLIWRYWSGSAWTTFTPTSDGTTTLSVTGAQDVTWDVWDDWAATSLNGELAQFYVTLEVATTMTTNPIIDQGFITDPVEHQMHMPTAGTYDLDGAVFFGSATNVENSSAATLEDSYAFSNRDTFTIAGVTNSEVGQSITGANGVLSRAIFEVQRAGSPTGNVTCRVYAHTGSFGSGGTPTGGILAESNAIDITTIPTTFTEIEWEFEDEFTLVTATNYFVVLAYNTGSAGNNLQVGVDNSAPSHGGNGARNAAGWIAQTVDYVFRVHTGGIVTVNATESNPGTTEETHDTLPGATILVNTVNLTVTVTDTSGVAIVGARVAIYTDPGLVELMNEDTAAGGIATATYNYGGDQDISVRVRESPNTASGRYVPFYTEGQIKSGGYSLDVILQDETIAQVV